MMLKKGALGFSFALSSILAVQSVRVDDASHDVHPILSPSAHYQEVLATGGGEIKPLDMAPPHTGNFIPLAKKRQWNITCSSSETNYPCKNLVDDSVRSFWQSQPDSSGNKESMRHSIMIDLKEPQNVHAIRVTLRKPNPSGGIVGHTVYLSNSGGSWGTPVSYGSWFPDNEAKYTIFEPQQAQFVYFEANSAIDLSPFISVVAIDVWVTSFNRIKEPELGIWGPTIDFPLVPVAAFVNPLNGKVVAFSSQSHDGTEDGSRTGTRTATWDRNKATGSQNAVGPLFVSNTGHDMFCPGMAFDVDGHMVVTGGTVAEKTSIYDPESETWASAAPMVIPRGYHGSTTCADGRIFVLGGSWSGKNDGIRSGEISDRKVKKWTQLSGCNSADVETKDWSGSYRADNHLWLLSWKDNSIFHAGPSKDMHWISTSDNGSIQKIGTRSTDDDAMCGIAVMYNAVDGKILTAGGAPNYDWLNRTTHVASLKEATTNAFIITLDKPYAPVTVVKAGKGMTHKRIYHHGVVLPNGETFVVGGQIQGEPWTENTAQHVPEIYAPPPVDEWRNAAPHSTIRVYHSLALLLPDATVLVGGGGLYREQPVNHLDAQIYTPKYLLTTDGKPATRPVITNMPKPVQKKLRETITITTDSEIVQASLIRYGGATHSLNNDQRRIPLAPKKSEGKGFEYTVVIPDSAGIAIPGYYMLFVMNAGGVPSVSATVQILLAE